MNNKVKQEYHFPGQHKNEKVILLLRRHPFILLGNVLAIGFFIFLLIAFWALGINFLPDFFEPPYLNFTIFASIIWILFLWLYTFIIWADYYLDVWIITNERLLDIEQKGLFHRIISELRLSKIQDITSEVPGFIPTFFHFGNISIQTAAEQERFRLDQIPHPIRARRTIIKIQKEYIKGGNKENFS